MIKKKLRNKIIFIINVREKQIRQKTKKGKHFSKQRNVFRRLETQL